MPESELTLPEQPLVYTVAQATAILEAWYGRRIPARYVWRAIISERVVAKRPPGTRQYMLPRDQVALLAGGLRERNAVLLPKYLTVRVLARLVGKTEKAVLHLINAGKLPAIRHPRGWFMLPVSKVREFYDLAIPEELVETAAPAPGDEVLEWEEVVSKYGEDALEEGDSDTETDASN